MAAIIRKDSARQTPSGRTAGTVAFSFADMRGQADDYLKTVQQEAAKIVQQAHQQAEQIRRKAEIAGRQAAEAAVDEKIARRMDAALPAIEQVVRQLADAKGELQRYWERSAIEVATAIAERIIRREVAQQPQITLDLIADALRLAAGSAEITLHVNPADYENLGSQIARLAETLCQLAPSHIVADATVSLGGCRVVTRFVEVDQQIESQLRRIEQELE